MLLDLLLSIKNQRDFLKHAECEVIIVDNDPERSAIRLIEQERDQFPFPIKLSHLATPSVAIARNQALSLSSGAFIFLVDDDQWLKENWLERMAATLSRQPNRVGGVVSCLEAKFESPLAWPLRKAKVFHRQRFTTGTILPLKGCRTGGVLLRRAVVESVTPPFESRLGTVGSEDVEFYSKAMSKGWDFAAYDEIPIVERYAPERCNFHFVRLSNIKIGYGRAARLKLEGSTAQLWRLALQSTLRWGCGLFIAIPTSVLLPVVALWAFEHSLRGWGALVGCLGSSRQFYGKTS